METDSLRWEKEYIISGYKASYVHPSRYQKEKRDIKQAENELKAMRKRCDQEGNAWGSRGKCVSG